MRFYSHPDWIRKLFSGGLWSIPKTDQKTIYLTFDDGPQKGPTEWVLDLLSDYDAKATFFCTGKNVDRNWELCRRLMNEGHMVGGHGYEHLDGWKTANETYIEDVEKGQELIPTRLFRPPYGHLRPRQLKAILEKGMLPVFWSVISYDFDSKLSSAERISEMKNRVTDGDIVVFHDSKKAWPQLRETLPELLQYWQGEGYQFSVIPSN